MRSGILIVDKPKGMTSFDVCRKVRRIFGTKKVGHTGTLDPDATGVLPICIGQATRLAQYITDSRKTYESTMLFGMETDSQDLSGNILNRAPLPTIDEEGFKERSKAFNNEISQAVNPYSAIKYQGRPLYDYARKGEPIPVLPDRKVFIYNLDILSFTPEEARFRAEVGPGTYIRTLVSDLGKAADSLAVMKSLRRIESGGFTIENAVTLEELQEAENVQLYLLNMLEAVKTLPKIYLNDKMAREIQYGRSVDALKEKNGDAAAILDNQLLAVGNIQNKSFQPRKVFHLEGD